MEVERGLSEGGKDFVLSFLALGLSKKIFKCFWMGDTTLVGSGSPIHSHGPESAGRSEPASHDLPPPGRLEAQGRN